LKYSTESLGKIFDEGMAKFPDQPACWFMKGEITFKELRDCVHKFATFLQQNGLEKGDIVAINLPNCPQYLIAHFGTFLAGCVASGCSFLLSEEEIAYQLNDSKARVIVTLDAIYEKVLEKVLDKIPNIEIIIHMNISEYMGLSKFIVFLGKLLKKIPKGKVKPFPGKKVIPFQDVMNTLIDVKEVSIDVNNDLALLQYTGGTTGYPKGTELTHANIISNQTQIENWMGLESGKDISLSGFPLFHLAGLAFSMISVWLSNPQVLIANPRDSDHIIDEFINKKPTVLCNVPTLYLLIMNNPKSKMIPESVLKNVKAYVSGAAPFPAEAIRDFEKNMDGENKVLEVYGMTETSPILTMNPHIGKKKIGTVGLPMQDTDIRLIDIETSEQVGIGEPGEVICRGPQVSRGYYKRPKANAQTFIDGWFHTGDVGIMDEEGYLRIVDRTKDMLIVSGYKVYSVHVEDILVKHPDIELVAIIGIKDPDRPGSEIVKAIIKLKEGVHLTNSIKEDIKRYAREKLSKYKNPKIWEFREELPLTTVGKILKRALREEAK